MSVVGVTSHFHNSVSWEVADMNRVKEALADKEMERQEQKPRHGNEPVINRNECSYLV